MFYIRKLPTYLNLHDKGVQNDTEILKKQRYFEQYMFCTFYTNIKYQTKTFTL